MASSSTTIITSISSALDDMDSMMSYFDSYKDDIFWKQRFRLRNLKTFVLLAGKFGNDMNLRYHDSKKEDRSLGTLLKRIEDAVSRNSQKIHFDSQEIHQSTAHYRAKGIASYFQRDFQSLKEEIDEWYIAVLDDMRQSNSLTADEVGEITESIWVNLADFFRFSEILAEPMEALREHLNFLINICRFATNRGVKDGQMQDFLAHTEAVAIRAAHLCFMCGDDFLCGDDFSVEVRGSDTDGEVRGSDTDGEESGSETDGGGWWEGLQIKISMLLQKIKPINPHVCETYTQVISCSKLSRRLDASTHIQEMEKDSTIVMKNFVDSLISILWEMLRLDIRHVIFLKDRWQVLYERLRSLRTILKKPPNSIDEKTRDDIGVMVCDAGVFVCSFYQKNIETDRGLQDLSERIKGFLAQVEEKVPQTSMFNPSSIHKGFVDYLVEELLELTNDKVEPIAKSHVQTIKGELLYLRSILGEILELHYEQEELQALWNQVLEVAYRVEFLIDHLIIGDISDSFSMELDSVMKDIQNIKTVASKISYCKRRDIKAKEGTSSTFTSVPSIETASITTKFVGLQDEAKSIMDRLTKGSKQLRVIAIVGMGGLGKTTLAAKVYNDPLSVHHFHVRACCPVSQTLNKRVLLLELLNQIDPVKCSEMTEEDSAERLRKRLKGKRYLIVLDDIWTIEAWDSLNMSFPDDLTGSRIILTSRNHAAAKPDKEPLFLRQLTNEESLELLQSKLFPGKDWPPELHDLGMQIVGNCNGLPLTIVIVAGLLATTDQEGWKEIVDGLKSGVESSTEQCMNSMELSYKHLPDFLKPCFLYFGAFREDQEVSVRRLIRLWIAEGFVRRSKWKSLEDAAENYMKDLIGRSLIMVAKQRSIGGVKTCRIHDLLRDFCLRKAKDEHFLHLLKGHDELLTFSEPCNLRRLCIHSVPEHFKESKVFCPRARSLLFFSKTGYSYTKEVSMNIFLFHIFKFVSVLDLEQINLGDVFPSEIELLVQLRYLAVRGYISVIPSWVGNLSMLETFIVDPCDEKVSLPDTIWNLRKLKYLYIVVIFLGGGVMPIENLDSSSVLCELNSLSGVVFICWDGMEKQMRKFSNIRKLKCWLSWRDNMEEFEFQKIGDFLSRLESLTMLAYHRLPDNIQLLLCFPANLTKLTLSRFGLPWRRISTIGELPNLEVLKLLIETFVGETWEMEEGEFPKLRYLKLSELDLIRWTAADDHEFPCLQKLVLEKCSCLEEELPSCLESTLTLEMIEVSYCPKATASLVKHIEEQQASLGNSALKILVKSFM